MYYTMLYIIYIYIYIYLFVIIINVIIINIIIIVIFVSRQAQRVAILAGGFRGWEAVGLPVENLAEGEAGEIHKR